MNCPKCQSNDWKFASVVYKQGQTLNSNVTTGEHTTPFAQSSAPPDVPPHPGIKEDRAIQEVGTILKQYIIWSDSFIL